MKDLELTFTASIAESYKRLAYKLWYALSEFVDNSTQSYYNNKEELDAVLDKEGRKLTVSINYEKGESLEESYFIIEDNAYGMDEKILRRAFTTGQPPENNTGRSRYGLGMKTASFWLGSAWKVETTMLGSEKKYSIEVDISKIVGNGISLIVSENICDKKEHFTKIVIKSLHREFIGRTLGKVKSYLSSIYRYDLMSDEIDIIWKGDYLEWKELDSLLAEDFEGDKLKKEFKLEIGGKSVTGWAGVLDRGSRGRAGFALVQNRRVINSNYRPELIYGEQEGGRNDLINQRLMGEVFVDGFDVSHTKDEILWGAGEEEELEELLEAEIDDLIRQAKTRRVRATSTLGSAEVYIGMENISKELTSNEAQDIMKTIEIPSEQALERANQNLVETVTKRILEPVIIIIGSLTVKLYTDEDLSSYDPYVIADSVKKSSEVDELSIIFNPNHPHWTEIKDQEGVSIFIRQVVYDGVAEWKAWKKTGAINHDTVKFIKDNLLRIPFKVQNSSTDS